MERPSLIHECSQSIVEKKATQEAPYHFVDAGIPNVYLAGIKYFVCKVCERIVKVQIPSVEELMNALARALVCKSSPLRGEEVQFLRKRLGVKQSLFASILGYSPEQLSRWENGHNELAGATDRLVRLAYAFMSKDHGLQKLVAKVKDAFDKWSTSIDKTEKGERIVAQYTASRQWVAQPIAA